MSKVENQVDKLSMIQGGAILLTAISVFDLGYANYVDRGIWFNFVLFETQDPTFLAKNTFWDIFQFWGYCFVIVAICQVLKALPKGFTLRPNSLKFGKIAISLFFGAPVLSLLISSRDYDFKENALSSLVEYGWVPTVIMSWGLMISMSCGLIYLFYLDVNQFIDRAAVASIMVAAAMFFLTGLTLPSDQPFNHGVFGNITWYLSAIGILTYSFTKKDDYPILFYYAITTFLLIFSIALLHNSGVELVLWLTQVIFGFLIGSWFIMLEYYISANLSIKQKSTN